MNSQNWFNVIRVIIKILFLILNDQNGLQTEAATVAEKLEV